MKFRLGAPSIVVIILLTVMFERLMTYYIKNIPRHQNAKESNKYPSSATHLKHIGRPTTTYKGISPAGEVRYKIKGKLLEEYNRIYKSDINIYNKNLSETVNSIQAQKTFDLQQKTSALRLQREKEYAERMRNETLKEGPLDPNSLEPKERKIFLSKVERILKKKEPGTFLDTLLNRLRNDRDSKNGNGSTNHYFPKLIIIGVQKCGTSALSRFLNLHPLTKFAGEQYYFNRHYSESLAWYANKMPKSSKEEIVFEKSPNYFFSRIVAESIKAFDENIKIINIVCDPVRRIYSDFLHMNRLKENVEQASSIENFRKEVNDGIKFLKDFEKSETKRLAQEENIKFTGPYQAKIKVWQRAFLKDDFSLTFKNISNFGKIILRSCYSIFTPSWYDNFDPSNNFLTIDGTRLYTDPGQLMIELQNFLNLPKIIDEDNFYFDEKRGYFCSITIFGVTKCSSSGKGKSVHAEVPDELKQQLWNYVRPFIQELENLEGSEFRAWNW